MAVVALLIGERAEATIRYASKTGTGSSPCTTNSSAAAMCPTVTALTAAVAGDEVRLLGSGDTSGSNGSNAAPNVFTGANYMVTPPAGKSGTSGSPITVNCYTIAGVADPGGCLIDGQFARDPINIDGGSWWVIEDLNARSSTANVVEVKNNGANNIFRRIVAWDQDMTIDGGIFKTTGTTGPNTFEDVAGFGSARKVFSGSQGGNDMTCTRCWFRWEGHTREGPKIGTTQQYNSHDYTCTNCLITWSAESMPQTYTLVDPGHKYGPTPPTFSNYQAENPVGPVHRDNVNPACANIDVHGSMVYIKAADRHPKWPSSGSTATGTSSGFAAGQTTGGNAQTCVDYDHVLFVVDPTNVNATKWYGFHLNNATGNTASNLTTITTSTTADVIEMGGSDRQRFSSIAAAVVAGASPWTGTIGAQICNRYGTSTPLWPWPMNDRIRAATSYAASYNGPCTNCLGGRAARTETNVTSDIEALLGTIPSTCRTASSGGAPPDFTPSTGPDGSLDTFSGSGMGGWTTISGNGWTEGSGVATPTNLFSTVLWDTTYAANGQNFACEISALGTEGSSGFIINYLATDNSNRCRVEFKRVAGTSNDTYTIECVSNGSTTTLVAATSLGRDIAVGDKVMVKMTSGTAASFRYFIAGDQWYEFDTETMSSPPSSSKGGIGATGPWACTEFSGGGTVDSGNDVTAPTAPTNLSVTAQAPTLTTLSWTASTDAVGVTGYLVERGVQSNCSDCTQIGNLQVGTTFLDSSVSAATTYYYRVRATDLAGNLSSYSDIDSDRTPDAVAFEGSAGRDR